MRKDMKKLLCERPRRGHSAPSLKTGKRLDPRLDYLSDEIDEGPSRISSSRRSQHGWNSKELNENLQPLYRFLYSAVGRPWNDVYSEIREHLAPKKAIDFHVLFHLDHMVERHIYMEDGVPYSNIAYRWSIRRPVNDLYVNPETGLLCIHHEPPTPTYVRPVDSLHWYDNFWFKRETRYDSPDCGCVHFAERNKNGEKPDPWRMSYHLDSYRYDPYSSKRPTCIHGKEPIPRDAWYVVEYRYHSPDEVYKVVKYTDGPHTAERYGLTLENPIRKIYYRDVPDEMRDPIEYRKKSANKKELKQIRQRLNN